MFKAQHADLRVVAGQLAARGQIAGGDHLGAAVDQAGVVAVVHEHVAIISKAEHPEMRQIFRVVQNRLRQVFGKLCQRGGGYVHIKHRIMAPDRGAGADRHPGKDAKAVDVAAGDIVGY